MHTLACRKKIRRSKTHEDSDLTFGYMGRILRVNLSREKTSIESFEDAFLRKYLGGQGFIVYFLQKELKSGIDPLSPENKLIFATGPATGTFVPGTSRNSVGAKSPLTGGFGEAEVGGYWGAELKHAGFDAIIIEGCAENPVYLWIHNEKAEIRDATHIWGKTTGDAQITIQGELEDRLIRIAQIGPGGEQLVRFACVINDLRDAAGRTGMGAVMGSKKLKAIAVRGNKKVKAADVGKLKKLTRWLVERIEKGRQGRRGLAYLGTGGDVMEAFIKLGNLPIRNFRDGVFQNAKALDARTIKETVSIGMESCYACPVRCKKIVEIDEPWHVDPKYGGPEYEALAALGSNCGVDNLYAVCKANEICNAYSLDVISTGVTIGFAMECYEKGILTDADTGGIKLKFGNAKALVQIVEKIGKREGIGEVLAEGVKKAAEKIGKGAEGFAIHVKGLEVPMHEPRLKKGLGLGYAVSPTGAEHMCNLDDLTLANDRTLGIVGRPLGILDLLAPADLGPKKVRALIYIGNLRVVDNCSLMCYFLPWSYTQKTTIMQAVTGWNTTTWELMKTGERVTNLARAFNVREGFTRRDDWLPERFFHPRMPDESSETAVDSAALEKARSIYYSMMGWNDEGVPTKAKLEELDIEWVNHSL